MQHTLNNAAQIGAIIFYRMACIAAIFLVSFHSIGQTKKINGISFVASKNAIDKTHVQPVVAISGNYVALMPFGFVKDIATPEVQYNSNEQWFGETKEGLEQYAAAFRESNIKVMVKPQIWVWNGVYTGLIEMKTEADWKTLERSYEQFIIAYATIAQKIDANMLCIGTELEKFVKCRPLYWKQLIVKIRIIYKGELTYAANWDEFKRVPFWNQVDYIGIDAYFPLSEKKTPTVSDFENGWEAHKNEIMELQKQYKKRVLFTEYGYRSVDYTGKKPWESSKVVGGVNVVAQKNATQAIYNQFWKEDWFAGGFLWKWFHNHKTSGGENNNRFTPQNKPAGDLIKKLYAQ
jgi:hypothetical protein